MCYTTNKENEKERGLEMILYSIIGKFKDGKFVISVEERSVVHKGDFIEYRMGSCILCQQHVWTLDRFRTGLLNTDNPEISVETLDAAKLEPYKSQILQMMKDYLQQKADTTQKQLLAISKKPCLS